MLNVISKKSSALLLGSLAFVLLFAGWWALATYSALAKSFPSPLEVFKLFLNSFVEPIGKYTIPMHALKSLSRIFIGYVGGSVLGIVLGFITGVSKTTNSVFRSFFTLLKSIPPIAWIPLAILWFGLGEFSKYFIIFLGVFNFTTINAQQAAKMVDKTLVGAAKMLGADKKSVFFRVVLPSSVPQIFAGLQVALSSSMMGVLAAEMVHSTEGLGWIIIKGMETGNYTQIIVGMISIGIAGAIIANIMRAIERRLCSWTIAE